MNRRTDLERTRLELTEARKRIHTVMALLDELWAELVDNLPGYPTTTTGGGGGTLDASGNPAGLDRYLTTPDPAATDLRQLRQSAIAANQSGRTLQQIARRWLTTPPTMHTEPTRGTDCQCCDRWVPGTDTDRLRAGLCMACYRDWKRTVDGNPWIERSLWMHQRRQRLDEHLEPTG